jgi:hypothetical protein
MTDLATPTRDAASMDDAAKIAKIRALLATPDTEASDLLAAIRRLVERDRPEPAEIYQKPWG